MEFTPAERLTVTVLLTAAGALAPLVLPVPFGAFVALACDLTIVALTVVT